MALNCTITKARAKTTPVSAIIPLPIELKRASAEEGLMLERVAKNQRLSSLGRTIPASVVMSAYKLGMCQFETLRPPPP